MLSSEARIREQVLGFEHSANEDLLHRVIDSWLIARSLRRSLLYCTVNT